MKKRKNLILLFICSIMIFNVFNIKVGAAPIYINARCAIAMDSKTGIVLFEQKANNITPMASTTKIMTALVAIKYGDLDKKIEISKKAASVSGNKVKYRAGEELTLRELLYGLMLKSGNDAAIAIAEGVSGSVEEFLKLMNEYAEEIGACNSHFETPHGLDSQNHYTTAYDLALITSKAKEDELFSKIVNTRDIGAKQGGFTRSYHNINKILYQIPNANGVKTGYTGGAGKCLVTSVKGKESDIIIVVINCPGRWKETKKIYDYCKENYKYKTLAKKGDKLGEIQINEKNKMDLLSKDDIIIPVKNESQVKYEVKIPVEAPNKILKGENLGKVQILQDEEILLSMPLEAEKDFALEEQNIFTKIIEKLK
ncbi:D-alanyl-D-alanine carboxypeptidase family protein [Clostridium sediminicola]|uniref:D-alanyl-D-alanine carboxypeptidase family protein n=1 Tax=Clostridium sediminicola TaxID=3114879 RepID=UPI0031F23D90